MRVKSIGFVATATAQFRIAYVSLDFLAAANRLLSCLQNSDQLQTVQTQDEAWLRSTDVFCGAFAVVCSCAKFTWCFRAGLC
jgi:hypothetical protein